MKFSGAKEGIGSFPSYQFFELAPAKCRLIFACDPKRIHSGEPYFALFCRFFAVRG